MRLAELKPQFLRRTEDGGLYHVRSIAKAQGVMFLCHKCFMDPPVGPVGTHRVVCWSRSRGVPDDAVPGPGRWKIEGTGYDDLTLNGEEGGSRSVLLTSGCGWHGFITNGDVTSC